MVVVVTVRATEEGDRLVCQAARGDYLQEPPWTMDFEQVMKRVKGDALEEKTKGLIRKLMDSGHWGPFEHPTISLGVEGMSRVTLAQLTRHRLASFDIQSARVVRLGELEPKDLVWPPSFIEDKVKTRDGGLTEIRASREDREKLVASAYRTAIDGYRTLVEMGVPKEDARYVMPEATAVHGIMTVNARSLMHIIALRTLGDAQWEIRGLARQLLGLAQQWMPITFKVFEDRWMRRRGIIGP